MDSGKNVCYGNMMLTIWVQRKKFIVMYVEFDATGISLLKSQGATAL